MIIGNAISFGLTGYYFKNAENSAEFKSALNQVIRIQTYGTMVTFVLFQVFFRNAPETPPSAVALAPMEKLSHISGMKRYCGNKSLVLLTIAVSLFTGVAFSFGNVLSSIFSPYERNPFDLAMFGMTSLLGGFLGVTVCGMILDKTNAYKRSIQVSIVGCILNFGFLAFVTLTYAPQALFLLAGLITGFCAFAVLPAALGLGVELTFPLQPVLVNGVMFLFIEIANCIVSFLCTAILNVDLADYQESSEALIEGRKKRGETCFILICVLVTISFSCVYFVKEDLKRLNYKIENGGSPTELITDLRESNSCTVTPAFGPIND